MTAPAQVEQVVHAYLTEVREAAQEAVARAFAGSATPPARARRTTGGPAEAANARRRSEQELADLQAQLEGLVRSQPGESMVTFAARLSMPVRSLQRPMTQLKRAGRVRTVGERHLTRYFPVAGRASSAA